MISKLTNNLMRVRLMQTVTDAYAISLNRNKGKLSKIILVLCVCVLSKGRKLCQFTLLKTLFINLFCNTPSLVYGLQRDKSNQVMQSDLARKMRVAKGFFTLEISPPTSYELRILQEDVILVKEFIQHECYKYLTVKQAWLIFLVCTEVGLWFFMGETIGKMHFVGYKV